MNKKINSIFSIVGFMTELFYLINALNICIHHITISFTNIIDLIFMILIVIIGIILIIISMIFYKKLQNNKCDKLYFNRNFNFIYFFTCDLV